MRTLLLGLTAAAVAVAAAPAAAQSGGAGVAPGGTQFSEGSSVAQHRDGRRDDRRYRRGGETVVVMDWNGGQWAAYNNQSWRSDSYNDWWHDRPDRAYPRWIQNNQDCQRIWWSGGAWRC